MSHNPSYFKERYARMKAANLCVLCEMVEVDRYIMCLPCRQRRRAIESARRKRVSMPCVVCHAPRTPKSVSGLCKRCTCVKASSIRWTGHAAMTQRERYGKQKQKMLAYMAQRYAEATAKGLCVRCNQEPVTTFKQCLKCREKVRQRYLARTHAGTRERAV